MRNKEKASLLESLGVRPVLGTLDDAGILSAEAEKADVVIHTANSADHIPSCQAILEGMKKRSDTPILIHIVSGSVVLTSLIFDVCRAERVYWPTMHAENMVSRIRYFL